MPYFWTDEEKLVVAARLRDGFSAGEIATLFPRHSRNSVIGVVHRDKRLKEIGFMTPAHGGAHATRKAAAKEAAAKRTPPPGAPKPAPRPPKHKPENRFAVALKGVIRSSQAKPIERGRFAQRSIELPVCVEIESIDIPMMDICTGQCRWPMWQDQGAPDFPMCGAATKLDKSYCEGHRAKAATPARFVYG